MASNPFSLSEQSVRLLVVGGSHVLDDFVHHAEPASQEFFAS
jgi:hypothetical protein